MRFLRVAAIAALALAPACCETVKKEEADPIPSWHPHAARRRQERLSREAAEQADVPAFNDFGCGTAENSKWVRDVCFGELRTVSTGEDGLMEVEMNVTVTVRDKDGAAQRPEKPSEGKRACGDALRIRFLSTRSIFAPSQREVECGLVTLSFILPPDAPQYEAEIYIVHIDGEGMLDPSSPRLFPFNLVNKQDGPPIYNILVAGFKGRLHIPSSYLSDPTHFLDPYNMRSAGHPLQGTKLPSSPYKTPICVGGEAPGRWMFHQSLVPQVPGEPLEWRPYRCHYRWYTGEQLTKCFDQLPGPVKLVGESTLGQLYELLLAHMNATGYYWPNSILVDDARNAYARTDKMRAQGLHSEFHGLSVVHELAEKELEAWPPSVVVQLQAANDAARDTFAMYQQRLREWVGKMKALIAAGKMAPKRWIWITAPVRHYKAGNGPGMAVCKEGTLDSCTSVYHATQFDDSTGEVVWLSGRAEPPMFFGTLDRRRAFNAHAVEYVRSELPELEVVDFEALTEALPSDYCIDGEHWGCNWRATDNRHREPYQCKALGNIVLAQVFSNVLCNKILT